MQLNSAPARRRVRRRTRRPVGLAFAGSLSGASAADDPGPRRPAPSTRPRPGRRQQVRQARPAGAQRLPRPARGRPVQQLQRPHQQHPRRRRRLPRGRCSRRSARKSRAAGATPITVAAGDLIGASPLLSAAFHDEPTIEAMNQMGLQVASVGNHEFDEGCRELQRMQRGGCLDDGDGENGADSCPGGKGFDGADFQLPRRQRDVEGPGRPRAADRLPRHQGDEGPGREGRLHRHDPRGHRHHRVARPASRRSTSTTRSRPPTRSCRSCASAASSRSSCCCTRASRPPTPRRTTTAPGRPAPAWRSPRTSSPQIDAVVSGHTHQPYNCVVEDPKGNPRLLTSASSLGRMVSKLHFLIDPKSGDIVRPAAFAENHDRRER